MTQDLFRVSFGALDESFLGVCSRVVARLIILAWRREFRFLGCVG